MPLAHGLEINALTVEGVDGPQLLANWKLGSGADLERESAKSGSGVVPGAGGPDRVCSPTWGLAV